MINQIYEHLKTKKKYNTLLMKYEILEEDYEKKVIEYNQIKRELVATRGVWEEQLKKQEQEIIRLKKRGVKNVSKSKNESAKLPRKKSNDK